MLRGIVSTRQFALADLFLVSLGGILWMLRPEIGILSIIVIALAPWLVRLMTGAFPFRRTPLDWLVVIFLVTAWVGYWAAYDQAAAWHKVWLIVLAVLLYYALASQPQENLGWICILLFGIGVSVSIYFLLTYDFLADPRKVEMANRIGRWIMEIRPSLGWEPVHPNYAAGVTAITTPFIAYPAIRLTGKRNSISVLFFTLLILGVIITLMTVFVATSRGVILAVVSALGTGIVWWLVDRNASRLQVRCETVFPILVLFYLCAVVLFLFAGPANSSGDISGNYYYGNGSRAELFTRSLDLVSDFAFTGGGLDSFPGLYAHYMLGIPFLNVANSHNMFLDVTIEQGVLGGLAFLMIFMSSIWFTARAIAGRTVPQMRLFAWLVLFSLVIAFVHGMVDNYLYNENGALLSLVFAGHFMTLQPKVPSKAPDHNYLLPVLIGGILIVVFVLNQNRVRSAWYADLGALEMAKVELRGFPTGQWAEPSTLPAPVEADASLQAALMADPTNRTANHRLGLISMQRGDFHSAADYLETAMQQAPDHRGIIKSLGYCYVWLGEMGKAEVLLNEIPEAEEELGVYVWWWGIQGRDDLSANASLMISSLSAAVRQ